MAIERACNLLEKYADAEIQTGIVAYDEIDKADKKIEIEYKFIKYFETNSPEFVSYINAAYEDK